MLSHRVAQCAIGQVLQFLVETEAQISTGYGVLNDIRSGNFPPVEIAHHTPLARHTRKPFIVGELQTLATTVIDVSKTDEV